MVSVLCAFVSISLGYASDAPDITKEFEMTVEVITAIQGGPIVAKCNVLYQGKNPLLIRHHFSVLPSVTIAGMKENLSVYTDTRFENTHFAILQFGDSIQSVLPIHAIYDSLQSGEYRITIEWQLYGMSLERVGEVG